MPLSPLAKTFSRWRFHAPEAEQKHPWLKHLLDAYAFLDAALAGELARKNAIPACRAGCAACCKQPVPLTSVEAMGLRIFAREAAPDAASPAVGKSPEPWHCPFLLDETCSVYPLRPFACRRYMVFNLPCAPGEEPLAARPEDVFQPSRKALTHALRMLLPVYEFLGLSKGEGVSDKEFLNAHTLLIQEVYSATPWQLDTEA